MAGPARNGSFLAVMTVLMAGAASVVTWIFFRNEGLSVQGLCLRWLVFFLWSLSMPGMRVLVTSGCTHGALLRAGSLAASSFFLFFWTAAAAGAAACIPFPASWKAAWASIVPFGPGGGPDAALSAVAALLAAFLLLRRETGGVAVRRIRVAVPGLPSGLEGVRIVHFGDLHFGFSCSRARVSAVADAVLESGADFACFTGDLADVPPEQALEALGPVLGIGGALRTFMCVGNHDCCHSPREWIRLLESRGFRVLLNERAVHTVRGIPMRIAGITDPAAFRASGMEGPDPGAALEGGGGEFTMLLSHRPEFARRAAARGVALQLSGHTHGGQLFFLFPLVSWLNGGFRAGLHRVGSMVLCVTPGCGHWSYVPMRIGVRAEVDVLTLVRGE